jgi:LysR family transcriptional regulator, low CO2-responsive transcriptional regulator
MSDATPSHACLRAIAAVTEEGSFSAAARRTGLSHTAITQQIRTFESRNGLKLFEREWGRLKPTPLCIELTEVAERIREAEAEASRLVSRRNSAGRPQLTIGLGNAMPGIAIVAELVRMHPGVCVTVETGSHQSILGAVLRRDVDVAMLPDIPPDPRFRRSVVLRQEVVAIVPPGHPFSKHDTVSLEDLAAQPLIFRSRGSSTQRVVDRAFARLGFKAEPRLIADTRDAVYEAVSLGIGIGFMWRNGTHRTDAVRRLPIEGIGAGAEEVVFALADERNEMVDLFFLAASQVQREADA